MKRYLTEPEQKHLLNHVKQFHDEKAQRDYHIINALISSGMRIGEFLQINVGDVVAALESKYLYIPAAHRKGGKRDHSVYLTQTLRYALIHLLGLRNSNDPAHYLVAGRHDHEPMSVRNMQQRLKQWAIDAGLGHLNVTPHFFRHTHAMNIIRKSEAKEPLRFVQAALGHRNINTTAIYTQASREELEMVLDEVDMSTKQRITRAKLRANYLSRL